ncbi:hypothetical protein [Streptomyces sp. NPDC006552]|uniref:hypothetical protein n=1 Tax=Streptomyces sp. NPDC006552 TaxID=3157179 RepID=UPI0033BB3F93
MIELSALLQTMPIYPEAARTELFRNPNGVARKTVNITCRHADYPGKPTNGNALDVAVLNDFLARPVGMTKMAQHIRDGLTAGEFQAVPPGVRGGRRLQRTRGQVVDTPPQES